MPKPSSIPACFFMLLFIIGRFISIIGKFRPWPNSLPRQVLFLDMATKLRFDPDAINTASSDFGKLVQEIPSAVFYPSSVPDIIRVINVSYNSSVPFGIAARGHGHSIRGQAMAPNGVVIEMSSLSDCTSNGTKIKVSWSPSLGYYADVGGEQLWIDVLRTTLDYGLAPVSWTDYLYLTVGGTLSNAGISGQTFRHGPQISNVHELDVITGKGEFITCSKHMNSELYYAVLGGLGQFGIITRARIVLDKAPTRVKWLRIMYDDFSSFTRDQEYLISINDNGVDYVEGSLILQQSSPNNWRSSFFSASHQSKISSLLTEQGILYCMEVVKYYDDNTAATVDQELELLLEGLHYIPGFLFKKDDSFVGFLNRVRSGELKLQSKGLWDVPHPWLNLFVPKSRIMDFNAGVFVDILLKQNKATGPILVYPTSKKMWDERMSAVVPDEDTFYCVGLLQSGTLDDWKNLDDQNNELLEFCDKNGIEIKQYLPHYKTRQDWMNHFGSKWSTFQERKARFDPKMILSPGQKIFNFV
ncbi:cytokinin dehydrogenase 3-like [Coffea eugenioides]|uniref:cytokinin dehydrogenase 3-like n=1 Tax=Coffea eugenioides TaxID=49369 RepID=UPI000F60F81F|nr:cytokinin dehydrogenase 3-like [Coffea eugenioides]